MYFSMAMDEWVLPGFARGLKPAILVQQSEDEKYLDQLLMERKEFD
jgi:hypothetical protein